MRINVTRVVRLLPGSFQDPCSFEGFKTTVNIDNIEFVTEGLNLTTIKLVDGDLEVSETYEEVLKRWDDAERKA
jgi:hypothetical protein